MAGDRQVFHAYAVWNGWAFDHSGRNPEPQLLAVNEDFEGRPLDPTRARTGDDDVRTRWWWSCQLPFAPRPRRRAAMRKKMAPGMA